MTFYSEIETAISNASSRPFQIISRTPIGGGCISQAESLKGRDRNYFLKHNTLDFHRHYEEERDSLIELDRTHSVRVPKPLCLGITGSRSYLVLEYIAGHAPKRESWTKLGRKLAELHKPVQPFFGWHRDNTIGATLQKNTVSEDWIAFFLEYRLEFQVKLAQTNGFTLNSADLLFSKLPQFFCDYTPFPSLLHGDLWSGNRAFDSGGDPFIFDPCCYYGDRETDLAFTEFFGGFHTDFYTSYNETFPLESGYESRKTLYNLYHCLNHYNLFGSPYDSQAQSMTNQLLKIV